MASEGKFAPSTRPTVDDDFIGSVMSKCSDWSTSWRFSREELARNHREPNVHMAQFYFPHLYLLNEDNLDKIGHTPDKFNFVFYSFVS